jgi:hypothetical protein
MDIDWKQKLSSRKFWAGVAAWVTSLLTAFNITENTIARVGIIVAGIGSLCVYMLAEAKADAGRTVTENTEPVESRQENKAARKDRIRRMTNIGNLITEYYGTEDINEILVKLIKEQGDSKQE